MSVQLPSPHLDCGLSRKFRHLLSVPSKSITNVKMRLMHGQNAEGENSGVEGKKV